MAGRPGPASLPEEERGQVGADGPRTRPFGTRPRLVRGRSPGPVFAERPAEARDDGLQQVLQRGALPGDDHHLRRHPGLELRARELHRTRDQSEGTGQPYLSPTETGTAAARALSRRPARGQASTPTALPGNGASSGRGGDTGETRGDPGVPPANGTARPPRVDAGEAQAFGGRAVPRTRRDRQGGAAAAGRPAPGRRGPPAVSDSTRAGRRTP